MSYALLIASQLESVHTVVATLYSICSSSAKNHVSCCCGAYSWATPSHHVTREDNFGHIRLLGSTLRTVWQVLQFYFFHLVSMTEQLSGVVQKLAY